MISKELYNALKAWQEEADKDEPSLDVRLFGLCNFVAGQPGTLISMELNKVLHQEYGDDLAPFNDYYNDYGSETEKHLNTKRREFVTRKIKEYEDEQA